MRAMADKQKTTSSFQFSHLWSANGIEVDWHAVDRKKTGS